MYPGRAGDLRACSGDVAHVSRNQP